MQREKWYDNERNLLYLMAILTIISIIYWTAFVVNQYNNVQESIDLQINLYSMYWHIAYPSLINGIQYLVFWNHISPDQLLVLPFFYAFPYAQTLIILQAVVLCLTAMLVFWAAREITKSAKWAFALGVIYLINSGIWGLLWVNYHTEFLLVPTFILTFYFCMKRRLWPMIISLALLLGALETAPYLGLVLGLGLWVYDSLYTSDMKIRKERKRLSMMIIAISIIALFAYVGITAYLKQSYATSYTSMPGYFQVEDFNLIGFRVFSSEQTYYGNYSTLALFADQGYMSAFMCFGILLLFEPIVALIFAGPWLGLTVHETQFALTVLPYLSYVLGATFSAAMLSINLMNEKKGMLARFLVKYLGKDYSGIPSLAFKIMIIVSAFMPIVYFIDYTTAINVGQAYFFQDTPQQAANYSSIEALAAMIPQNASVMTAFVLNNLEDRKCLEAGQPFSWFFAPKYVITTPNQTLNEFIVGEYSPPNITLYNGNMSVFLKEDHYQLVEKGMNGSPVNLYEAPQGTNTSC